MDEQKYLQHSLRKYLDEAKSKNERFGLRAFAKKLGISASALSEFLNGKRHFSLKMAERLIERLNIDPEEGTKILARFPRSKKDISKRMKLNQRELQLQADQYWIVADPIYYSLLCLLETIDYKEDSKWIARRLKTTKAKIDDAIDRLGRLGLIYRDREGKLYPTNQRLNTTDDITNLSLRKRHEQNLDDARDAINNVPTDRRYYIFETLSMDPKNLERAKAIMNKARNEIIELSEEGSKTEVYEFCFHAFPRSNTENFYEN